MIERKITKHCPDCLSENIKDVDYFILNRDTKYKLFCNNCKNHFLNPIVKLWLSADQLKEYLKLKKEFLIEYIEHPPNEGVRQIKNFLKERVSEIELLECQLFGDAEDEKGSAITFSASSAPKNKG